MIVSRLTTKAQTTIPLPVRSALGIGPGDVVAYHIRPDGSVLLTKAPAATEDPFHSFEEWDRRGRSRRLRQAVSNSAFLDGTIATETHRACALA
jgi:antitoxin PrlF